MGEKELFHQCSVKIPLIIVDPSSEADKTRGQEADALVEAIDLVPSFVDYFGGQVADHVIEGKSLLGILRGEEEDIRDYVISEYDYSPRKARNLLEQPVTDCRTIMVFDGRYKLIHVEDHRPILFDLETDPSEFTDLGESGDHVDIQKRLLSKIFDWSRSHHNRTTISDKDIADMAGTELFAGIKIGFWDQKDVDDALTKWRKRQLIERFWKVSRRPTFKLIEFWLANSPHLLEAANVAERKWPWCNRKTFRLV